MTRQKNIDYKKTIEAWRKREKERIRHKKRHFERGKQLRAVFAKYEEYFDLEKEKVVWCCLNYNDMMEQFNKERKEEKILNDLLAIIPETTYAEVKDLERAVEKQ